MEKERDYSENVERLQTCFLSSFPPRNCGIGTFSEDLCTAMDKRFNPVLKSKILALNDNEEGYDYPEERVPLQMSRDNIEDYIERAKQVNESEDIKIVCIQHEFGLFGGEYGAYLIPFLELVQKPKVVVFHTVLPNPDEERKKIVRAIAKRVSAMIVISQPAVEILERDYGIEKEKIYVVPHGTPNVPFQSQDKYKKKYGLEGKIVLTSHGWLSVGKGMHYAIKALPELVKKYPDIVYLVLARIHPGASYEAGPRYMQKIKKLVKDLNLEDNVKFVHDFLPLPTLMEYFLATDVYLFTNLEKEQISSGVLVRVFGCGRAIVSTPIVYAEDLLRDDRGILVKFKNPKAISEAVDSILSNPKLKKELEKNAYYYSRQMTWSNVALSYLKIFNKIRQLRKEITEKFPEIKLDHLIRMTDDFGVVQFAEHTTPDKTSGYTLDDNCRALITSVLHNKIFKDSESLDLTNKYLDFIQKAQSKNGNIKNQHQNKEEKTDPYSEDAFGRAIWTLGFVINKSNQPDIKEKAEKILKKSFNRINALNSPRSIAFVINGLTDYYKESQDDKILSEIKKLSQKLLEFYYHNTSENWKWFENYLTYDNPQIPRALFLAYSVTKNEECLRVAKESLDFLSEICIIDEKLFPIGQNGWYNREDKRVFFDQQPVDASGFVQAYLTAYENTLDEKYYNQSIISFNWFLGTNHLDQMIYDDATGGCFDGLGSHSLNFNQGAESTISYLMARLFLEEFIIREKQSQDERNTNL